MGDPVRCLPKVVHPDVAALKLQHNPGAWSSFQRRPDDEFETDRAIDRVEQIEGGGCIITRRLGQCVNEDHA